MDFWRQIDDLGVDIFLGRRQIVIKDYVSRRYALYKHVN